MRAGKNYLDAMDLAAFKDAVSWDTARKTFISALAELL